jgi:hypothetical protein
MQTFIRLVRWLYPAAYNDLSINASEIDLQSFLRITRVLLKSDREEGFFLAIKCINEDNLCYAMAIREQDFRNNYLGSTKIHTTICQSALTGATTKSIHHTVNLMNHAEKLQLRSRLRDAVECCLPTILWAALCDIREYQKVVAEDTHQQTAKLLYTYSLTFLPESSEMIESCGISELIKLVNPKQSLKGLPQAKHRENIYNRTLEARKKVLARIETARQVS